MPKGATESGHVWFDATLQLPWRRLWREFRGRLCPGPPLDVDKVHDVPYDARWHAIFQRTVDRLAKNLASRQLDYTGLIADCAYRMCDLVGF
jgi:hypothetical protein